MTETKTTQQIVEDTIAAVIVGGFCAGAICSALAAGASVWGADDWARGFGAVAAFSGVMFGFGFVAGLLVYNGSKESKKSTEATN